MWFSAPYSIRKVIMRDIYREEDVRRYRVEFMIFSVLCMVAVPVLFYMKDLGDNLSFGSICYVSEHFHFYCPGCGGTRAVIALLNGRLIRSFICNPYPLCICTMVIRIWCTLLYDSFVAGRYRRLISPLSYPEVWGVFFLPLLLFIVRNVLLLYLHVDPLGDLAAYRF